MGRRLQPPEFRQIYCANFRIRALDTHLAFALETRHADSSSYIMSNPQQLVQKLWNYCNILRDDGLSYGDYVEQLTFLLFLKMADEQMKPPYNRVRLLSKDLDWVSLERLDGDALESHYRHVLTELGKQPGMLGVIFRKAQNKVQDPAKLKRLITDLIGKEQWMTLE